MAGTYRAVMLTKKGGPEALQIVELPVEPPGPGQLRVRVRAAGVGSTDLVLLTGKYRFAPKIPLVPGYEVAGVVEGDERVPVPRPVQGGGPVSVQLGTEAGALSGLRLLGAELSPDAGIAVLPCWVVAAISALPFVAMRHRRRRRSPQWSGRLSTGEPRA